FFWFVIAEGGVRCTEPGITKFIEDHPQLFRDLAEEETRTIPEAVIRLRRELELDQVSPGDLPRVPVRKSGKPTLADIFRVFCSEGQAWPPIEIFRRLGGVDRDFFLESLRVLIDSGVITKYGTDLYQVVDRPGETKQKIQQILDEYAARPQTSYQSIQKRLLEVLDPYQKDETHIADVFGIIHNARGYLPVHKIAEITGITAPEKLSRYLDSLTRMETVVRRDHVQGSPAGDTVYRAIPMTAQQALKLKAALYELAFNPKIGISSVRSEIREILAADRPVRIADVFRHISRANKALTLNEILQGLGIEDSGTAAACLSDLIDAGVIIKYPGREGRTPTCGLARLTGDQTSRIAAILDASDSSSGKVDLKELKAKIYTVSETVWANALLDTVAGLRAQPAKQAREKIVIAIETDWLPGLQDLLMQGVIRQLDKLEKKGTVRIVRGSGRDLADKLKQVVETERIPVKNIVVLADRKTVEKQEFALIRAEDDSDPDKAFIVGVDAGELTDNTYVRLLEMLTLALRLASSQKLFSNHSGIKLKKMNSRYYIFTPKAEPFDIEIMKELYSAQKRILSAA
ncbi:MAG: hypothetical protein KAS86_03320, partial [Candidatus Omnitrophica bacterium]|nr:hypothetical protein [Candidatus Omnitrophota bacterium]